MIAKAYLNMLQMLNLPQLHELLERHNEISAAISREILKRDTTRHVYIKPPMRRIK